MNDSPDKISSTVREKAKSLCLLWMQLCERYLPVGSDDSIWRFSRHDKPQDSLQGWKIHLSATIFEACDLLERVAPLLISKDIQFKAPVTLDELSKINCGLSYGYHQVGKFITIYPSTDESAVELARQLHELTTDFFPINVPFDEQYLPDSSVFYRYGSFKKIEVKGKDGNTFLAVRNPAGKLIPDDRLKPFPEWISDPFPKSEKITGKSFEDTPLGSTYRIFQAVTQRGKGGVYKAIDLSQKQPRLCIVKEGRHNGDLGWNGQDGYFLVSNEFKALEIIREKYDAVPQVFESFEIYGNFYFAMEYVDGKSLNEIMKFRMRRYSVKKIVEIAVKIADVIKNIHQAGWIWNDCKPANLIVTENGSLRPIDFEGAYPIGKTEPFDWKTKGFSNSLNGVSSDTYALGAVIYFLLTGKLYDSNEPVAIEKLRRNIPRQLIEITKKMLEKSDLSIAKIKAELEKIRKSI